MQTKTLRAAALAPRRARAKAPAVIRVARVQALRGSLPRERRVPVHRAALAAVPAASLRAARDNTYWIKKALWGFFFAIA